MLVTIIILTIAIITLFTMMMYRAWEIKTSRIEIPTVTRKIVPEIYFRQIEKIMLYLAKHIVQWVVLVLVKAWFIVLTKSKKWLNKYLPKIANFFKSKPKDFNPNNNSFVRKAILESRSKIRRIKEKVIREHE